MDEPAAVDVPAIPRAEVNDAPRVVMTPPPEVVIAFAGGTATA